MAVNIYKSDGDEIFEVEDNYDTDITDLLSPANLDIEEEEWSLLVRTDPELAAQVGHFLLKRNKSLEMLITTTETCAEEHKIRANHYEKQIQYMRDSMEAQAKSYEIFEKQVGDLTDSYHKISDECRQYKERNKSLWEIVATLEEKCEDYLVELELLKSSRNFEKDVYVAAASSSTSSLSSPMSPLSPGGLDMSSDDVDSKTSGGQTPSAEWDDDQESDIVSLKMYAEETSRKNEIERCQRFNAEFKLDRAYAENKDLRHHILFLEHRLRTQIYESISNNTDAAHLPKSKSESCIHELFDTGEDDDERYEMDDYLSEMGEENYSIKELFQRFHHRKEETRQNSVTTHNRIQMLSGTGSRKCSDVRNPTCTVCKAKLRRESLQLPRTDMARGSDAASPEKTPKSPEKSVTPGDTAANYRDMFAQIFEKLKISRAEAAQAPQS